MEKITPFPFLEDWKGYKLSSFRRDLTAAASVALLALPQSMAYAFVADLPTSAGIFAAIFGTIFTAAFGASRYLISGPTNSVAILIQSGTADILFSYYRDANGKDRDLFAMNIILQLVFLIGIFQILGGLFKLGRLTQFASRSVVVGYMSGAALVIAITQLFPFFGIREMDGSRPLYQQAWFFLSHLHHIHIPTAVISIVCLGLLFFLYKISNKIPAAAIVFTLISLFVYFFQLSGPDAKGYFESEPGERVEKLSLVQDAGPIEVRLPQIKPPVFDMDILIKIVPLAFAITLLTILEATSIGRQYRRYKDPPYPVNQEVYGLGMSNFLSAFFGAMPSSGSFSRTSLNQATGAKTRFAAIYSGVFVFLIVWIFGFLVDKIPIAALAALMLFTAYTMINFKEIGLCFKSTRADALVVLGTFAASILFPLDVAFYVGIGLSILLYLRQAATPGLVEYSFNNIGKLRQMEDESERLDPRICIVQIEGELFFGAADSLSMKFRQISEDENLRAIILQMINARHIDASICITLDQIHRYLKSTDRILMLSGVSPEVWDVMKKAGLIDQIGEEYVFPANERVPSEPTRKAYALAKEILGKA